VDGSILLRQTDTRSPVAVPLDTKRDSVTAGAIGHNNRILASASSDHVISLWNVDRVADACARAHRNLSLDEWTAFLGAEFPCCETCANTSK
jgi:hypothetical protein